MDTAIRHSGGPWQLRPPFVPETLCLSPRLLEQVRECLTDLTPAERRTLLSTNAARVYTILLD
jgi:hypothetical protein